MNSAIVVAIAVRTVAAAWMKLLKYNSQGKCSG